MACSLKEQFKHYCRVCKKGFMCGRALGGHMRAHEGGALDDDDNDNDNGSDWEEKLERSNTSKRMYQLRTNPNRLKSCRTCDNCGKEFLSWKSFLEHGNAKCTSDDALLSDDEDDARRPGSGWSKRKRSLRSKVSLAAAEEDDILLATCLVQLANTTVALEPEPEAEESSASDDRRSYLPAAKGGARAAKVGSSRGVFECKACKKVFNSHQALGGHRASHKKVKGCYAAKQDEPDEALPLPLPLPPPPEKDDQDFFPTSKAQFEPPLVGAARRKSKVHECSICHRVFNSGQALGGHKRCHWIISNSPETSKFQLQPPAAAKLDLNVPAWAHMSGVTRSFDVSTDMHLHPWHDKPKPVEDEADSNFNLPKFTDFNDANVASSQWLQVGIASTTANEAAQPGDV